MIYRKEDFLSRKKNTVNNCLKKPTVFEHRRLKFKANKIKKRFLTLNYV